MIFCGNEEWVHDSADEKCFTARRNVRHCGWIRAVNIYHPLT